MLDHAGSEKLDDGFDIVEESNESRTAGDGRIWGSGLMIFGWGLDL